MKCKTLVTCIFLLICAILMGCDTAIIPIQSNCVSIRPVETARQIKQKPASPLITTTAATADANPEHLVFSAQYIRWSVYDNGEKYPLIILVNSKEELQMAYGDIDIGLIDAMTRYDDAFFFEKALVIVYLKTSSGSNRYQVTDVKKTKNNVIIHIKQLMPQLMTCDMAEWNVLVELSKEDIAGAEITVETVVENVEKITPEATVN